MKVKYLLAIFLFASVGVSVYAQEKQEEPKQEEPKQEEPKQGFDKSKVFIGGTLGLSFGDFTMINLCPQVGYRFNKTLAAGFGINGIYSSSKSYYTNGNTASREEYGVIGLNIFGRVYPIPYAFLHLQPEVNYTWGTLKEYTPDVEYKQDGKVVPALLAGVGAIIPAGRGGGGILIMAQYDLLQNDRSPYGSNVFFSFGFSVGL